MSDGVQIKVWTVIKEDLEGQYQSINNAPLNLLLVWMIHRDLISDMNFYITKLTNDLNIDLDWE